MPEGNQAFDMEAVFDGRHPCEHPGCEISVPFDDEPWCFGHSPEEGSYVAGYSYKAKHRKEA